MNKPRNLPAVDVPLFVRILVAVLMLPAVAHWSPLQAQLRTDAFLWVRTGGGPTFDSGTSVAADPSTNAVVLGVYSNSMTLGGVTLTNAGLTDIFLAKYRGDGALAWARRAGGAQEDGAGGVACDEAGNIYTTGFFRGLSTFDPVVLQTRGSAASLDGFLCRHDPSGKLLWAQQFGGTADDRGYGVAAAPGGGCFLVGSFQGDATFGLNTVLHGTNTLVPETFVARYGADGGLRWVKRFATTRGVIGYAIAADAATNAYVTGEFVGTTMAGLAGLSATGDRDAFVLKLSPAGDTQWAIKMGGALADGGRGIGVDAQGNAVVTGYFNDQATFGAITATSLGKKDIFVARVQSGGTLDWVRVGGGTLDDSGTGVSVTPEGVAFVSGFFTVSLKLGSTALNSAGNSDAFLARYGSDGTLQWLARGGGAGVAADSANGVALGSGGDVFLTGEFAGDADFGTNQVSTTSPLNRDFFLARRAGAPPPTISQAPTNTSGVIGSQASFSVIPDTSGSYTFQWFHDGAAITNATNAVLVLDPVAASDAGRYQVSVRGAESSLMTDPAELQVRCLLTLTRTGIGEALSDPSPETFPLGSSAKLFATPDPAYFFQGWTGGLVSQDNPATLVFDGNETVNAVFVSRALTTAAQGNGRITRAPDKPLYDPGDEVLLTAIPESFFRFLAWSDGATDNPRTVLFGATNAYTAVFTNTVPVETVVIGGVTRVAPVGTPALLVNGEFVTRGPRAWGDSVTLDLRTTFTNGVLVYSLDGSTPSRQYSAPIRISGVVKVRAAAYSDDFATVAEMDPIEVDVFETFSLAVTNTPGGTLTVTPLKPRYLSNDLVTLVAVPTNGWSFAGWAGDASGTYPTNVLRVTGNRCVRAVFGTPIALSATGAGGIELQPVLPVYPYGSTVKFTALPAVGSNFVAWSGAFTGEANPQTYDVTRPSPVVRALFLSSGTGSSLVVREAGAGTVLVFPRLNVYTNGQSVVLIASPAARQSFLGWTGDVQDTTNRLTLRMTHPTFIDANFTQAATIALTNCGTYESIADLRLQVSAPPGAVLDIQRSEDLALWGALGRFTNSLNWLQVADPGLGAGVRGYYRAVSLPEGLPLVNPVSGAARP